MDANTQINTVLANSIAKHLAKKDPQLAKESVGNARKILDEKNVKYELDGLQISKVKSKDSAEALREYVFALPNSFEEEFGINKTWEDIKTMSFEYYRENREVIRKHKAELPLTRYTLKYSIFQNVFGFYSLNFRTRVWMTGAPISITNRRLFVPFNNEVEEVPISMVYTIGREIYVGYDSSTIRGIIRSIDYDCGEDRTASILVVGGTKEVKDFNDILSAVREEWRRLSPFEETVLFHIGQYHSFNNLLAEIKFTKKQLLKALARLQRLHYLNETNKMTPTGINMYAQIKRRRMTAR